MMQEQHDVEHNLKIIDQPSFKALTGISKASSIRLLALTIMLVAALFIYITSGMTFYNHNYHRGLIGKSVTNDLQSTTTSDLTTSVGPNSDIDLIICQHPIH
jgi:hypothetical protein